MYRLEIIQVSASRWASRSNEHATEVTRLLLMHASVCYKLFIIEDKNGSTNKNIFFENNNKNI
jgi:hypothetical protein